MSGIGARAILLVVALVAVGYLAVQLQASHRLDEGKEIAFSPRQVSPSDSRRAERRLEDAEALNNDATPDIYRAIVIARAGRRQEAIGILQDVVRREPENVEAWGWLEFASRGRYPALNARVRARIRELNPQIGERQ